MTDPSASDVPLPSGWPKTVKAAVLHVISLARYAIVAACGWARRLPVRALSRNSISVSEFPLPKARRFVLAPVQYVSGYSKAHARVPQRR